MLCMRGIQVSGQLVPCGKCPACRVNQQRQWAARIMMEWATHHTFSWFVTLTYDDEHLPLTPDGLPTLQKKKTRKWLVNQFPVIGAFRYYLVGEYGDKTGRPHYHLAVFPESYSQIALLTERWKQGFTSAYEMSENRALYLAKYTTKKLAKTANKRLEDGVEPEFRTSSGRPPIGYAFIPVLLRAYGTEPGQAVLERDGDVERSFRIGGRILPIPRPILARVREHLKIPRLHEERMAHEGYYARYCAKEYAEWEPDKALKQEIDLAAKKEALKARGTKL